MGKLNWKKILVFTVAGAAGPVLSNYTVCVSQGTCPAFTLGNVALPIGVGIMAALGALFSNPRYRP